MTSKEVLDRASVANIISLLKSTAWPRHWSWLIMQLVYQLFLHCKEKCDFYAMMCFHSIHVSNLKKIHTQVQVGHNIIVMGWLKMRLIVKSLVQKHQLRMDIFILYGYEWSQMITNDYKWLLIENYCKQISTLHYAYKSDLAWPHGN